METRYRVMTDRKVNGFVDEGNDKSNVITDIKSRERHWLENINNNNETQTVFLLFLLFEKFTWNSLVI